MSASSTDAAAHIGPLVRPHGTGGRPVVDKVASSSSPWRRVAAYISDVALLALIPFALGVALLIGGLAIVLPIKVVFWSLGWG